MRRSGCSAIALLALTACTSAADPPPIAHRDAAASPPAVLDEAPASPAPCERRQAIRVVLDGSPVTVDLPLPCVPFDRLNDTPDPQP